MNAPTLLLRNNLSSIPCNVSWKEPYQELPRLVLWMPVLLRYGLSFVTIVWVLPSGASNHAKVLSILKQTKYASYKKTPAISPREWRRLKVGDLSVGFYLWTSTQNHKLLLFSQTYLLSRKQHQAFCAGLHEHLPPVQGPERAPSKPDQADLSTPFLQPLRKAPHPLKAIVKHFICYSFFFLF